MRKVQKRKKVRGILTLLLAACLFTQMFGTPAFADANNTFPDVPSDASYASAVYALAEQGIMRGDDQGNFNPDSTLTRAEAATVICRLCGVEADAKKLTSSGFSDVPSTHWAIGYIAEAAKLGIVNGYGNGKFGPEDKVTYAQIVKMLVCACGLQDQAGDEGGWPDGYLKVADTWEITQNTSENANDNAPRKTVAILCYNTIGAF